MSTAPTTPPQAKGRGAWTRTGGLLPGKPGGKGTTGYYRSSTSAEQMVGSAWFSGYDTSDNAHAVWFGVQVVQGFAGLQGKAQDGLFGPMTFAAVVRLQKQLQVAPDGIVGPTTMKAALAPLITVTAGAGGVPPKLLGGIVAVESQFDPAAVGYDTPADHGLVQINLRAHVAISLVQAMDPMYALTWAANTLGKAFARFDASHHKDADPWLAAVLNHNSPRNAKLYATTGLFPTVQAQTYVERVVSAW